jgi:hypothetical protein
LGGLIGNHLDKAAMRSVFSIINTNSNGSVNSQLATRCSMEAWGKIACFLVAMTKRILAIGDDQSKPACNVEVLGRIMYFSMVIVKRLLNINDP